MRFDGKLEDWNDERGFGSIAPQRGGDPVHVHISAFPPDGRRPRIGEPLSFEVEAARDGKRHAINVQRPGHKLLRPTHTPDPRHSGRRARSPLPGLAIVAALVGTGIYAYTKFSEGESHRAATEGPSSASTALYSAPAAKPFQCDGRTRCTQMTSCEEVRFFLKNCPDTRLDGTGDDMPCEQQWCTGQPGR
jgi:cold shock CspA family protein